MVQGQRSSVFPKIGRSKTTRTVVDGALDCSQKSYQQVLYHLAVEHLRRVGFPL